jgi:uncharacterized repeat protein (TIGR01451 family)
MTAKTARRLPVLLAVLMASLFLTFVQIQVADSQGVDDPDGNWPSDAPYEASVTSVTDVTVAEAAAQRGCNTVSNPIANCGFETGDFTGWVTTDLAVPYFPLQVGGAGISPFGFSSQPTEGSWAALHGFDGGGPGFIQIAQDVNLPDSTTNMLFDYRGAWSIGGTQDRHFQVNIEPFGGGTPLQTITMLTATAGTTVNDTGPLSGSVDLSAFAGTPVRISFHWVVPEYFTGPAFFQLDNVLVEVPTSQHGCNTVSNPIVNCSFETGDFTGWTTADLAMPYFPLQVGGWGVAPPDGVAFGFFLSEPTEGSWAALHGFDGEGPGFIQIAQDVNLPDGTMNMLFDYRGAWDLASFGATQDRQFQVNIEPFGGGTPLQTITMLTATAGTTVTDTGPLNGGVDLSAFAGSAVRISFHWVVPEDFTGPAFFQLDNVLVEVHPDLALEKSAAPEPAVTGEPLTYELVVTNNGPPSASNVTLVDMLPASVTFVSANASQGSCSEAAGVVTCTLGTLGNGAQATVEIVVLPTAGGVITNTATVTADEPDFLPDNNEATVVSNVRYRLYLPIVILMP